MKKFIVLFMTVLAMMSYVDSKTFERADGAVYEVYADNIFWDVIDHFIQTDSYLEINEDNVEQAIKILNK